jgi:hypothetical protein
MSDTRFIVMGPSREQIACFESPRGRIPVVEDKNWAAGRIYFVEAGTPGTLLYWPNGAVIVGPGTEVNAILEAIRFSFTPEDAEFLKSLRIAPR